MLITRQDASDGEWEIEAPAYWVTFWRRENAYEWSSETFRVCEVEDVREVLDFAASRPDRAQVQVECSSKPVGLVNISGTSPIASSAS